MSSDRRSELISIFTPYRPPLSGRATLRSCERVAGAPNVHVIQLLRVKAHAILKDDGVTLIDTGYAGSLPRLTKALADLDRTVSQVRRT